MNNKITTIMNVNKNKIRVIRIENEDFNLAEFCLIKRGAPKKSFTIAYRKAKTICDFDLCKFVQMEIR